MQFGRAQLTVEEDAQASKHLTFCVDREEYAVGIGLVSEIVTMQPINPLPEVPAYIKGVINLRGKIIPVADMRLRFGREEAPYTDRTCVIIVEAPGLTAGLIVDGVCEVVTIGEDNIEPPPDILTTGGRRYISGIGKVGAKINMLIDCEKLFDGDEEDTLAKMNTGEEYEAV